MDSRKGGKVVLLEEGHYDLGQKEHNVVVDDVDQFEHVLFALRKPLLADSFVDGIVDRRPIHAADQHRHEQALGLGREKLNHVEKGTRQHNDLQCKGQQGVQQGTAKLLHKTGGFLEVKRPIRLIKRHG